MIEVCKRDFEIWDRVLARMPGVRLETISHASDRRDAALMAGLTELRAWGHYRDVRMIQTWWGAQGFGFRLPNGLSVSGGVVNLS